jgi:hypothetical protein
MSKSYQEISNEIALNDVLNLLHVAIHVVETTPREDLRGATMFAIEMDILALARMLQERGGKIRFERIDDAK